MTDRYYGERKIILNDMIHGNVLVTIHGEIKKIIKTNRTFKMLDVSKLLYRKC